MSTPPAAPLFADLSLPIHTGPGPMKKCPCFRTRRWTETHSDKKPESRDSCASTERCKRPELPAGTARVCTLLRVRAYVFGLVGAFLGVRDKNERAATDPSWTITVPASRNDLRNKAAAH